MTALPANLRSSDGEDPFSVRAVYYVNTKINEDTWIRSQLMDIAAVHEQYVVADAKSCAEEPKLHDAVAWLKTNRNERVIELVKTDQ